VIELTGLVGQGAIPGAQVGFGAFLRSSSFPAVMCSSVGSEQ